MSSNGGRTQERGSGSKSLQCLRRDAYRKLSLLCSRIIETKFICGDSLIMQRDREAALDQLEFYIGEAAPVSHDLGLDRRAGLENLVGENVEAVNLIVRAVTRNDTDQQMGSNDQKQKTLE